MHLNFGPESNNAFSMFKGEKFAIFGLVWPCFKIPSLYARSISLLLLAMPWWSLANVITFPSDPSQGSLTTSEILKKEEVTTS